MTFFCKLICTEDTGLSTNSLAVLIQGFDVLSKLVPYHALLSPSGKLETFRLLSCNAQTVAGSYSQTRLTYFASNELIANHPRINHRSPD